MMRGSLKEALTSILSAKSDISVQPPLAQAKCISNLGFDGL